MRVDGDGDFYAKVLNPFRRGGEESRFGNIAVALGRVVEPLAGIEEWEGFGADSLASPENRVVDRGGTRCTSGSRVHAMAEYNVVCDAEQGFVYFTANFWR